MKYLKSFALAAASAAMLGAPLAAHADLIVQITDGTTTLNIADGGALDGASEAGIVAYAGPFGLWNFTMAAGSSDLNPLQMHLTSSVFGTAGDGQITIRLTQTNLTAGALPTYFGAGGGGSGANGSTASWFASVDDSNAAFGTGSTVFSSDGYTTASGTALVGLSDLYSATLSTTIDYAGVSGRYFPVGSSLDVGMHVPEPGSMALMGGGLIALFATKRRRKA